MRTLQKFSGINNVKPTEELATSDLVEATNIDLDLQGRARRRAGYEQISAVRHGNVWEAAGFTLATRGEDGDLINVDTDTVLVPALGHTRIWYWNLPDGRTLYSNGTAQGIVSAAAATPWGVPMPTALGDALDVVGQLHPGKYQWALTHQRLSDGIEGPPIYSGAGAIDVALGGVSFSSIPVPAGYRTRVYLTSHYGGERYLAGTTTNGFFVFTGKNETLQLRCPTDLMQTPPVGRLVAFWRGRTLVAVGNVLFASRPNAWEIFDLQRDYKQFSAPITLVQPVDGGIWVGTEKELAFLSGPKWDDLVREVKVMGTTVLGSGCSVPGEQIAVGRDRGRGDCVVCIADGWLVAGMADGSLVPLTLDRYRADVTEVVATFREVDGVPQYIATEQ